MGSTFAALHVRTKDTERALAVVRRFFQDADFEELAAEESAPRERRVLVFPAGAWVAVADEDMETDAAGDELAGALTRELDTEAIAISVFHSDAARLVLHARGERKGAFEVPADGRARADGHEYVDARFLAGLALDARGRDELERGLLADHTFPERTTHRAATLVGIEAAGAGARYLWNDPPAGATKLRFRSKAARAQTASVDWRPPGLEGDVQVAGPTELACAVGAPLQDFTTFQTQAFGGARVDGLGVELSGSGLELLEIDELAGWNPVIRGGNGRETKILVAKPERANGRVFAAFPEGFVAPAQQPALGGTSAADMRAFSEALAAMSACKFVFHVRGRARAVGSGEIVVRLVTAAGAPLDAAPARLAVSVRPAPRAVILPEGAARGESPHETRRRVDAAEAWNGAGYLALWIGFDGAWAEHEAWLVALAEEIAEQFPKREISLTSDGTHPKAKNVAAALAHLRGEGDLRITARQARDASAVRLRHQPEGTTILPRATRERFAAARKRPRIVPIDFSFATKANDALARRAAAILEEAAARATCVGGFVVPLGTAPYDDFTPYEELAGTSSKADHLDFVRTHPRCPGWRFIVPAPAARRFRPNERVRVIETRAGLLVASTAPTPSAMTSEDRDAVERSIADKNETARSD